MMNSQEIIQQFKQSKIGRVLSGKESFRNKVGRVMHGMAYKHRALMVLAGVGAAVAGVGLGAVGTILLTPIMFAGVYGGISPKKNEKAACEALMNIAVRKGAALARFMERKDIPASLKQQTLQEYLNNNMPLGCHNEYQQKFPDAVANILNRNESEAQYHNPSVYLLEAVQEEFTRSNAKGGILHGMGQVFTRKYYQQEAAAKKIAAMRWQDRQQWEQMGKDKLKWPEFMNAMAYQRKTSAPSMRLFLKSKENKPTLTAQAKRPNQPENKTKQLPQKNKYSNPKEGSSYSF